MIEWSYYLDLISKDEFNLTDENAEILGAATVLGNTSEGDLTRAAEEFLRTKSAAKVERAKIAYKLAAVREEIVQARNVPSLSLAAKLRYTLNHEAYTQAITLVLAEL